MIYVKTSMNSLESFQEQGQSRGDRRAGENIGRSEESHVCPIVQVIRSHVLCLLERLPWARGKSSKERRKAVQRIEESRGRQAQAYRLAHRNTMQSWKSFYPILKSDILKLFNVNMLKLSNCVLDYKWDPNKSWFQISNLPTHPAIG